MMLERSILVVGRDIGEVSVCSCALLALLSPYKWAGTFIPVLPNKMSDFLSSPVPYVTGMALSNTQKKALLNDSSTKEAMSAGLSVIELDERYLSVTSEEGVEGILPLSSENESMRRLLCLHARLSTLSKFSRPLQDYVEVGCSPRELSTLESVNGIIYEYLESLGGSCATTRNAWQRYGMMNRASDCFEFYPGWFMEQYRQEIKFRESLVHTQLFVSFVEKRRKEDIEWESEQRRKEAEGVGQFIADFVYFQFFKKGGGNSKKMS